MEKSDDVSTKDEQEVINYRGVKAMPFIIGNETFEKLGAIGTSANLLVYFTQVYHMKSVTATVIINIYGGTTNFATLLGAFLSDNYFGRYKTIGLASFASFLGMVMLTLTAAIEQLHPPPCGKKYNTIESCQEPTAGQMAFLISSLALLVIGAGGIRPCNLAFGADQFNPNTPSGKKGIDSFFNWYYFTFTIAVMISLTGIVYIQSDVSWAWGLAIPAALMFISCVLFFVGTRIYVKVKPDGSPFASATRVLVAAVKKKGLKSSEQPSMELFNYVPDTSINSKLSYTDQFRFLNKAAIITKEDKLNPDGTAQNPWNLCSIQQIEELKCLVRILPIWVSVVVYYIATTQQQTYVVFQALQSNRLVGHSNFKIPAATYSIFIMLALTIWIPIYDRILVPKVRKITKKKGGITLLQRMGIGLFLSVLTMLTSAIVEHKRRDLALSRPVGFEDKRGAISSMSGFWLIPQLALVGVSEGFTIIGQIEFQYKQLPENMRSVGQSFTFVAFAVSSYLSGFMVSVIHRVTIGSQSGDWLPEDLNKGRLDYFYYLICGLEVLNLGYFVLCAEWYQYKESEESDEIEMGNVI